MTEYAIAVTYSPGTGKYLIVQRSELKTKTGEWEFPSGSVEESEKPRESAVRELKEETGLEADIVDSGKVVEENRVFHVFKAEVKGKDVKLSEEHSEYRWVEREQIPNPETADNMGEVLEAVNE